MDDKTPSQPPSGSGEAPATPPGPPSPPPAPSVPQASLPAQAPTPVLPNLKALPYDEAMAVMHRLLTYQKVLEQEIAKKEEQLASWQEKVDYARAKQDGPLAVESELRLREVQAEYEDLAGRLETERVHNAILKDQLAEMTPNAPRAETPGQQAAQPAPPGEIRRRSDLEIERDFQRHHIEDELSAIKSRMQGLPPQQFPPQ